MLSGTKTASGLFAAVLWVGVVGCTPWNPQKDELNRTLDTFIFQPQTTCDDLAVRFDVPFLDPVNTPDQAGINYQEYLIQTDDGTLLRIWYLPTQLNRGTIVLSMGSSGDMSCYLYVARLLLSDGWSIVLYDYRGFGGSTGVADLEKLAPDLEAVVDFSRSLTGREQVTLMGISLGTIPSVAVAVARPDAVNGVILDAPIALGEQIKRFDFVFGGLSTQIISRLDPAIVSESLMPRLQSPVLIVAYSADAVAPLNTVQVLFDLAPEPKTLAVLPDLGHALGPYTTPADYLYAVEGFLNEVWNQSVGDGPPAVFQEADPTTLAQP